MKIYEIRLKPTSFFITPLQGDTLFGCLCWQLVHKGENIDELLKDYSTNPFMVVSSGFFYMKEVKDNHTEGKYIFPKPLCPDFYMFPQETDNADYKANKKKKVFALSKGAVINTAKIFEDKDVSQNSDNKEELKDFAHTTQQAHNTINRMTGTTGDGEEFAPFYTPSISYDTNGSLVVFAAIDESRINKDTLQVIFENLGKTGYGKKASSGYGHFTVESCEESTLWHNDFQGCNALYALAPFVLSETEKNTVKECFFQPITKYGKHGDSKALSDKPFKKPVIMADTASIVSFGTAFDKNKPYYIGSAVKGTSYTDNKTVMQGYALCLPCKLEEAK